MEKNGRFGKGFVCGMLVSAVVAGAGTGISQNIPKKNKTLPKTEDAADVRLDLDTEKVDEKLEKIEQIINENYLNEVDTDAIEEGLYKGMIGGLGDPYAAYYTRDELKKLRESTSGAYQGIGAKLSQDPNSGVIKVVTCFEGTPAQKAGLQPGDILYTVNGTEVTGKDLTDVVSLIKTAEGDHVHMQIVRDGENDYLEFDVERSEVSVPTVAYKMMDDNIGYIAISEFDEVTAEQFRNALTDLEGQGMEKLIIDLRNNLGGLLDTCCEMLRQILPEGLIVYTEDKDGNRE